ncbi:MAG: cache domain-containing protein [Burkholderiales bacterium]|nr:cache domain-containing protein [Burkholderiales bacterium]
MLRRIHDLTIAKRLGILIASALLGMIVLTILFVQSERSLILEERQNNVRQNIETVYSLVAHYHGLIASNNMPEEDAKKAAINAVKALRYGDGEYFWINDMQPRMIMHPIKVGNDNRPQNTTQAAHKAPKLSDSASNKVAASPKRPAANKVAIKPAARKPAATPAASNTGRSASKAKPENSANDEWEEF